MNMLRILLLAICLPMTAAAAEVFQTGVAEHLFAMGLIGASALSEAKRMWRKVS